MENEEIARKFEYIAALLESRDANPYRVQAYRNAANNLRNIDRPLDEIVETEGKAGLEKIAGVGKSIARSITEYLYTGRMSALERIRGRTDPIALIASLPSIGPDMAERIYEHLGVETLEDLEAAAHDGDLAEVPGFGKKRLKGVMDALAGRLRPRGRRVEAEFRPGVGELLDVDHEYREKITAGALRKIAPKRFNPSGEAWLPILYTRRGNNFYTALFSNTLRAHELGRTNDWVILYYDGPEGTGQSTVVTSKQTQLKDKRVVRGREDECKEYYERKKAA